MKRVLSKGNKKKSMKPIFAVWGGWALVSIIYFIEAMLPSHIFYTSKDSYTVDSVWHYGSTTQHNDVLLYTLFGEKVAYVSPKSWYVDYVKAYSEEIVISDELVYMKNSSEIALDDYTYMGHMVITANSSLFDETVLEAISANDARGTINLYIDEKGMLEAEGIEVFHDENGNMYLGGRFSE